jgi:site-specific recombinase XerD
MADWVHPLVRKHLIPHVLPDFDPKQEEQTPTAMGFLELVNRRLDHVKAYNSESHYRDHIYLAKRWIKQWKHYSCGEILTDMIEPYLLKRSKVSAYTANRDLRCLRALFNFGVKRKWVQVNPTCGIPFLPVERRLKHIPPKEDVLRVIMAADPEIQDYLWTIKETMARTSEVNR